MSTKRRGLTTKYSKSSRRVLSCSDTKSKVCAASTASVPSMTLRTLHPGITLEDVQSHMAWDPRVSPDLSETPPPTADEIRLLREELDPEGIYTK